MSNSGYVGNSKSVNAVNAEENNIFSATKIAKLTKTSAKFIKEEYIPCEWHHTSGAFNRTNYYDLAKIKKDLENNFTKYSNWRTIEKRINSRCKGLKDANWDEIEEVYWVSFTSYYISDGKRKRNRDSRLNVKIFTNLTFSWIKSRDGEIIRRGYRDLKIKYTKSKYQINKEAKEKRRKEKLEKEIEERRKRAKILNEICKKKELVKFDLLNINDSEKFKGIIYKENVITINNGIDGYASSSFYALAGVSKNGKIITTRKYFRGTERVNGKIVYFQRERKKIRKEIKEIKGVNVVLILRQQNDRFNNSFIEVIFHSKFGDFKAVNLAEIDLLNL